MGDNIPLSEEEQKRWQGGPSHWYFTEERLKKSGSITNGGFDAQKELDHRQQAAAFIQELSSKLQLPNLVTNTAIVFMHRFYVYHSFSRFPRNDIAAACVFLAAKSEEQPRKLEHVVKMSAAISMSKKIEIDTNEYLDECAKLVFFENVLIQTLAFELQVEHPHPHVVRSCQQTKAPKDFSHSAYFMANESLHMTDFCLRFRPTIVACACVYIVMKWANWEIPISSEGKAWYQYVDPDVTEDILAYLAKEFVSIITKSQNNKLQKKIRELQAQHASGVPTHHRHAPNNSHHNRSSKSVIDAAIMPPPPVPPPPALPPPPPSPVQSSEIPPPQPPPQNQKVALDYKAYKERRRETVTTEPEKVVEQVPVATESRQSFMPDVSEIAMAKQLQQAKRMEKLSKRISSDQSGSSERPVKQPKLDSNAVKKERVDPPPHAVSSSGSNSSSKKPEISQKPQKSNPPAAVVRRDEILSELESMQAVVPPLPASADQKPAMLSSSALKRSLGSPISTSRPEHQMDRKSSPNHRPPNAEHRMDKKSPPKHRPPNAEHRIHGVQLEHRRPDAYDVDKQQHRVKNSTDFRRDAKNSD